jgi:hypothetical protein
MVMSAPATFAAVAGQDEQEVCVRDQLLLVRRARIPAVTVAAMAPRPSPARADCGAQQQDCADDQAQGDEHVRGQEGDAGDVRPAADLGWQPGVVDRRAHQNAGSLMT